MFKPKVKYVAHVLSVLFQECNTLYGQLTSLTLSCMENLKNIAKRNLFFFCSTSKRHKIHKIGARKFWLEANCRKFYLLSFLIGNYVFILNGFLAMTSQMWVGDFIHLIGQHALKGYNQLYSFLFKNVCSEHIH